MLPFNELLEEVLTENAQNGFDREENAKMLIPWCKRCCMQQKNKQVKFWFSKLLRDT